MRGCLLLTNIEDVGVESVCKPSGRISEHPDMMKTYKVIRAVSHSRLEIDINNYAGRGWRALSITISNEGGGEMFYALLERDADVTDSSSSAG